jgi:uncharacterized protein
MLQEAQPFFDGLKKSKLMLQRCQSCMQVTYYPRHLCPKDLGNLIYEEIPATGKILSYTVIHRCAEPTLQNKLPYIGAMIELDEKVQLFARLTDITLPLNEPLFNKQVEGHFEVQGEAPIIVFKLI